MKYPPILVESQKATTNVARRNLRAKMTDSHHHALVSSAPPRLVQLDVAAALRVRGSGVPLLLRLERRAVAHNRLNVIDATPFRVLRLTEVAVLHENRH